MEKDKAATELAEKVGAEAKKKAKLDELKPKLAQPPPGAQAAHFIIAERARLHYRRLVVNAERDLEAARMIRSQAQADYEVALAQEEAVSQVNDSRLYEKAKKEYAREESQLDEISGISYFESRTKK